MPIWIKERTILIPKTAVIQHLIYKINTFNGGNCSKSLPLITLTVLQSSAVVGVVASKCLTRHGSTTGSLSTQPVANHPNVRTVRGKYLRKLKRHASWQLGALGRIQQKGYVRQEEHCKVRVVWRAVGLPQGNSRAKEVWHILQRHTNRKCGRPWSNWRVEVERSIWTRSLLPDWENVQWSEAEACLHENKASKWVAAS